MEKTAPVGVNVEPLMIKRFIYMNMDSSTDRQAHGGHASALGDPVERVVPLNVNGTIDTRLGGRTS